VERTVKSVRADVASFLAQFVRALEECVAIVLAHDVGDGVFSIADLAARAKCEHDVARSTLENLERRHIVARADAERWRRGDELRAHLDVVDELRRTWESDRIAIVVLLSEQAVDRLRTGALRAFSDAFVLKRGPHD
jgi:hypothetical protein